MDGTAFARTIPHREHINGRHCFRVEHRFSGALDCQRRAALAAEVRMVVPYRGNTGSGTYFITASAYKKMHLLQSYRMADLLIQVLYWYREQQKFLLHDFVIMPNHFHLLITPGRELTIQRALQLIKGGFSFRAKKELGFAGEIWQKSFYDHRVRDWQEFLRFRNYIHQNPVRRSLARTASEFPYSSGNSIFPLDEVPERLKPMSSPAA